MADTNKSDASKIVNGIVKEVAKSQGGTHSDNVDRKMGKAIPGTQGAMDVSFPDDSDKSPQNLPRAKGEYRTRDFGSEENDGIASRQYDEYGDYY